MSTDYYMPTAAEPGNPDGMIFTTFLHDARVITPQLFTVATSQVPTVTTEVDEQFGEVYHVHFANDLTADEEALVLLVMQGNANLDALISAAKAAYLDNSGWVSTVYPQIVSGVNSIKNSGTSSTFDKTLADGLKTIADQMVDVCNQNKALIKMAFSMQETALS